MSVFYDLSKTPRNILNQAIVRAIVSENGGALFDPSDLSTLLQDAAGTIPVTAVEQPVGKMLDKSGNGYHATQSITASRPVLSARYNLLTKTEDFSDAVWATTVNTSVTPNIIYAPDGTLSVDKITITDTNYAYKRYQVAVLPSTKYTLSYYLETTLSASGCRYRVYDLTNATNIVSDTDCNYSGGGFVRQARTFTTPANCTSILVYVVANNPPYAGAYYYIWGADLRLGTSAGPYQRVNTATDYDTDPRYFPKYLRFDGVDDYLNLPYMGLYANGSASVVVGISRAKAGVVKCAIAEGNSAGGKNYIPFRLSDTGVSSRIINDAGTVVVLTPESAGSASSLPEVLSFKDTGNTLTLHKNSSQTNLTNYTRAGSLTLNNLTVGAIVQVSVTENMLANIYSLIITKSALTDAQRVRCERYAASKAGVIL